MCIRTKLCGNADNPWMDTTSSAKSSTITIDGTYQPMMSPSNSRRVHVSASGTWSTGVITCSLVHPSGLVESMGTLSADGTIGPYLTVGAATVRLVVATAGATTSLSVVYGCEVTE